MPDSPKPDITVYIGMIKAELSEHCLKLMERMDSCYEIEKVEITAHADEEIARLESVGKDVEETITDHADKEIERITTSVRANFVDLEKEMTEVERIREYLCPKDKKEHHPWGAFLDARLEMIKNLRDKEYTCDKIADQLSCTPSQVANIIYCCKL